GRTQSPGKPAGKRSSGGESAATNCFPPSLHDQAASKLDSLRGKPSFREPMALPGNRYCSMGKWTTLAVRRGLLAALLSCGVAAWCAPAAGLVEENLAPKSGPRGATMFREMSPQETGVVTENNFADPRMWTDHYQELVYGAIGTGIAVGDF